MSGAEVDVTQLIPKRSLDIFGLNISSGQQGDTGRYTFLCHLQAIFDLVDFQSIFEGETYIFAIGGIELNFKQLLVSSFEIDVILAAIHDFFLLHVDEYYSKVGDAACYGEVLAV